MTSKRVKWEDLTEEDRKRYVEVLYRAHYSDKSIADFFATTKGTVVGFRHTRLPVLTNLHGPSRFQSVRKPRLTRPRLEALLAAHLVPKETAHPDTESESLPPAAEEPVSQEAEHVAPEPTPDEREVPHAEPYAGAVTRKLATAFNQCQFSGGCGYERLPGLTHCGRPGHDR